MNTFNKLKEQFKTEGWNTRHLFMRGNKFIKDNYSILIVRNNIRLSNGILIGWHELYMREELRYQLKDVCSSELIELIIKYIEENL